MDALDSGHKFRPEVGGQVSGDVTARRFHLIFAAMAAIPFGRSAEMRVSRLVLSIRLQMEEFDNAVPFLSTTDTKPLEKVSGRTKKLGIGLGLLLLAVAVALITGLLVWHFNGNRPLYDQSPLAFHLWEIEAQSHSGIWSITAIGPFLVPECSFGLGQKLQRSHDCEGRISDVTVVTVNLRVAWPHPHCPLIAGRALSWCVWEQEGSLEFLSSSLRFYCPIRGGSA